MRRRRRNLYPMPEDVLVLQDVRAGVSRLAQWLKALLLNLVMRVWFFQIPQWWMLSSEFYTCALVIHAPTDIHTINK